MMLINCSHCRSPLVLPPGAQSIRCALCSAITMVATPPPAAASSSAPPPPWPPYLPPPPQQQQQQLPDQRNHSYPAMPPLQVPPPNPHGSKKALICGVSYRGSRFELQGCLNDAKCMKFLLSTRFHFPESSILLLTEDQADPLRHPTKHNMKMAMHWLVSGCQPGDSLFFHFSGHGSQQRNLNGSEVDGMDETILPVDFQTQGMIVDDEINMALVRPLPPGVRLHAVVDACHSGTVLDLPFLCKVQSQGYYAWEDHRTRGANQGTSGGEAFCFSGCDDKQTSADTSALSQVTYTGAMTFCFIQAIERGRARTYMELLHSMRYDVQSALGRNSGGSGGPLTSLIDMLLTGGSLTGQEVQEPQLTASAPFDINMPFYL